MDIGGPHRKSLLAAGLIGWFLSACAALQPPIQSPAPRPSQAVELRAHDIAPQGLLLRLQAANARPGDSLRIAQVIDDGDPLHLQTIPVDQDLLTPLAQGQVTWRAPLPNRPAQMRFELALIRDEHSLGRATTALAWPGWPSLPAVQADLIADQDRPAVRVAWPSAPAIEAHIQRRDVIEDSPFSDLAVIDPRGGTQFVDTAVDAADLFAYQVQFVDRVDGLRRRHPTTTAIYVGIPE